MIRRGAFFLLLGLLAGCASLGALGQAVQAPRFESADARQSQIRLLGPSARHPLGGLELRLWARVTNPNPFGLKLARLAGSLALEGAPAADVEFPLGLPLPAAGDTIIPLDLEVGFSNLPALAETIPGALARGAVDYRLNGTVAVDAGLLGQPSFGPMTLLEGTVQARR